MFLLHISKTAKRDSMKIGLNAEHSLEKYVGYFDVLDSA